LITEQPGGTLSQKKKETRRYSLRVITLTDLYSHRKRKKPTMPSNTFQYEYAKDFGKEDAQNSQQDLDKKVLKGLSQNHKESTMNFEQLLKKLRSEIANRIQKEILQKQQSLAKDLAKQGPSTFLYPTTQGFDHTQGEGSISAKLLEYQASHLATRREYTVQRLTLTSTIYKEDCSLTPACKDCTTNGPYSTCTQRKPQRYQGFREIPLSQYWHYVLYGKVTKG
jgi:hypothetical protein